MAARIRLLIHLLLVACMLSLALMGQGARAAPPAQGEPLLLGYGQTVEGAISPEAPVQLYAFDAQANDVVTISMIATGGELDPFIALTDTQQVQLATDDNSGGALDARLAFVIPRTGRYLIRATHAGGIAPAIGGTYTLSLNAANVDGSPAVDRTPLPEPTPTPAPTLTPATPDTSTRVLRLLPVTPGIPVQGSLTRQTAFLLYWFDGASGDQITATATGFDGFAPLVVLYDNSLAEIARSQPGEPLIAALVRDGVHLLGISLPEAGSAGGTFTLDLVSSSDQAEPASEAEPTPILPEEFRPLPLIQPGETIEGTIDHQRFMDIYTFLGKAGQEIVVEMTSLNPGEINGLDPFLLLLDDGRIPLAEHDDIVDGVERDARLEFTLPRTAYYAIVATRYDREAGTSAGPYQLTLTLAGESESVAGSGTPRLIAEPLEPNTPIQATFDGTPDVYRFDARAGELIDLSVTADDGVDPVLILATDTLSEVVSSGTGALTGLRTPAAGTYYLVVATRFGPVGPTGGYIVVLSQIGNGPPPAAGEPTDEGPVTLALGQTASGVIDDETPSRLYTFTGTAGERVRLTLRAAPGSSLDPYLELRDTTGAIVDANDDIDPGVIRDSQITATLPVDGEYQILVSRYVGPDTEITQGAYELAVELATEAETSAVNLNRTVIPLRYGQTQVGEITDEQYIVFYVFSGAAGDVATIEIDQLNGNLDAVLHLYQAVGDSWREIAYNDDSPIGGTYDPLLSDISLPADGLYLIAVSRYGLDKETGMVGTFSITLTRQQ